MMYMYGIDCFNLCQCWSVERNCLLNIAEMFCRIEWYRSLILQAWISLCCRLSAVASAVIQTLSRSLMRSMACCCCCRCCCAVTVPKSSSLLPSKKKSFGEFTRSDELQLLPAGHQAREFRHLHVANIVDLLSQLWSSLLLSQLLSMPS
jgi:hypothetical protein